MLLFLIVFFVIGPTIPLGAVISTARSPCGCPLMLKPSICDAQVVVFVPILKHTFNDSSPSASQWLKAGGDTVQFVLLAGTEQDAAVALNHGLPCLCVSATFDGIPYFDASIELAQTACKPGVVALLQTPQNLDHGSNLNSLVTTLSTFSWLQHDLVTAPPFGRYRSSPNHTSPAWLTVSGTTHEHDIWDGSSYFWMWNTFSPPMPLSEVSIPPFPCDTTLSDLWLLYFAVTSSSRHIVDISDVLPLQPTPTRYARKLTPNKVNKWSLFQPRTLASSNHTVQYASSFGVPWEAPWKAVQCQGNSSSSFCLERRAVRLNLNIMKDIPASLQERLGCNQEVLANGRCSAGTEYVLSKSRRTWTKLQNTTFPPPIDARHALEVVIRKQADQNKVVILAAASYGYFEYILNLVCNLNKLHVQNYAIAAFDIPIYEACAQRHLPAFLWLAEFGDPERPLNNGEGSYKMLCKLRIFIILHILKMGYSVFHVDPDVVLFRNPLQEIHTTAGGVMYVQSDWPFNAPLPTDQVTTAMGSEADITKALNAGFFLIATSPAAIAALEMVAKVASQGQLDSGSDDQPIYNSVLCAGLHGSRDNARKVCIFKDPKENLTLEVRFWPQMFAANGATTINGRGMFGYQYEGLQPVVRGQLSLHNNFIVSKSSKLHRQKEAKLWWITDGGACLL